MTPSSPAARRRLPVLAAVISGLLLTLGTGTAARAATDPPQLVALSVSPTSVTPPGQVDVHYTTTAATSTLGYVSIVFASPVSSRGNVQLLQNDVPLDGTVRWTVPDGLRNATYQLSSVTVMSKEGVVATTYLRDGTTSRGGTHAFDFPGMDVTVTGSNEDLEGPALTSVAVPTGAVKPGSPLTVTWAAHEAHGWKSAMFTFAGVDRPSTMGLYTNSAAELAAGRMTRPASTSLYNVRHTLASVRLEDNLGNVTEYFADGRLLSTPYDSLQQTGSHTVPLTSSYFTVSGSTFDQLPPTLSAISVDKNTIRTGDPLKVAYVAQDDTAPLEQVTLSYARPDTTWLVDLTAANLPLAGAFSSPLGWGGWPGDLTFRYVELRDLRGNTARYWRDGTVRDSSDNVTGRHTLDLSHLDVTVLPTQLSVGARSRPQSAQVSWSAGSYEPKGLTGYQITVNPGGRVITVPNHKTQTESTIVTGLVNATRYSFTVRSLSSVGPGPSATASATPLISGNVWSAGDVNGDRLNDLFAALPNQKERLYRGLGGATFGGGTTVSGYGPGYRMFPGDRLFGRSSFYALRAWENTLEGVDVDPNGKSYSGVVIGTGWGMRFIDGSADFTGDGTADLVGVTEGGNAYLYGSTSVAAKFTKGRQIATGWGSMQKVFAATDVTGDKRADLLGVDATGVLWIFPGTGRGTFSPKRKVSSGWGGLGGLFYARDLNGDGRGDLGAVTMDGTLRVYKGWGNGTFSSAVTVSKGWAPYL